MGTSPSCTAGRCLRGGRDAGCDGSTVDKVSLWGAGAVADSSKTHISLPVADGGIAVRFEELWKRRPVCTALAEVLRTPGGVRRQTESESDDVSAK